MRTAVFSVISPNYLGYARVLMSSVRRHHPGWERFVLIVDQADEVSGAEVFTVVPLNALALPSPRQLCFRYGILELSTAVKPWMFEHLFGRGYERVVYLDPDIFVYSPLAELDTAAAGTFLTLTPHLSRPVAGGNEHPGERTILQSGAYNLGFLAARRHPALGGFLAWWQEKLERECVVEIERGLFVDQKWIDLVPGLFPDVTILRHDGYNVAYWNLCHRTVATNSGAPNVNGQPLRFFHFSGLDPERPELVSTHDDTLRIGQIGEARALIEAYVAELRAAGYESSRHAPYAFGVFRDGTPVTPAVRGAYRNSRALQAASGADPFAYSEIFAVLPGVNIVGYTSRDSGVGESARLCRNACNAAGIASQLIDVDAADVTTSAIHRVTIHHINADETPNVRAQIPLVFESSAYNIGAWAWELPEFPDQWIPSAKLLNEIWAATSFIQSAVGRKLTIPVVHMPPGIAVTEIEPCSPEELGIPPGSFTFLCMFDLDSIVQRKNPLAAIDAFRRAFGDDSAAALLVKAGRAASYPCDYAEIEEHIRGMRNVRLTARMLSRARVNGLIAACDAVISLHRSEGFGLILAEAMDLGKPVIATAWSGNMDFMNSANSAPVNYKLVTLDRTYGPYRGGEQWAHPDLDHAAYLMQRVFEDDVWRARIGRCARETIRLSFSPAAAGLRYRRRLELLGLL